MRPTTTPGEGEFSVSYLAGLLAVAFIVFDWSFWPLGILLIGGLVVADVALDR